MYYIVAVEKALVDINAVEIFLAFNMLTCSFCVNQQIGFHGTKFQLMHIYSRICLICHL